MLFTASTRHRAYRLVALAVLLSACSSPEEQKQRHFEQGNAYVAEKRDDFAVIEYANAVRIDPKFGEARLKLAETYERMNNIQAAFPEYIRAADALPNNRNLQIKATELLILARRFEDAKSRATAMLEKNPKDLDALLLRANAMAELKDLNGALAEVEEAFKVEPTESRTYISLGAIRMRSGEAKEAEAAFRQALKLDPSSVNARMAFANFLWSLDRRAEAEQEVKQAIALEPRHVLANRMLAVLYMSTNRAAEAEGPLKVVADASGTPDTKFMLAQYYIDAGRPDDAVRLLNELAAGQTTFTRAEAMIAALDYRKGQTKEAHARVDKLLTRAPNDAQALALKARWLASEKKLDEALTRAKAATAADPRLVQAQLILGMVHSERRETQDAIKAYTEALRLNPRMVAAQVELARLNALSGNTAAAVRYAEEAKRSAPGSLTVRVALARSLLTRGELDRAQAEIAEMLRAAPNAASVHSLNGALLALRNNPSAARAAYERALALTPGYFEAVGGLVALDLSSKQFAPAIKRVEAALAAEPDRVELLTLAARAYDQAGQPDKAEQTLRRVVAVDPRFLGGYALLAQLYVKRGRIDDARREFETIVKRDPRAVGPRTMVGILLQTQGKRDEARRWYEATIADLTVAPVAANNLAYIYAEDGTNLDAALQLAESAKKEMPDSPEVNDTLGWVLYKRGLYPLAVGPLEEAVKAAPGNAEILYHLGMTYSKMPEKSGQARDMLDRALKINPRMASAASARQTLEAVSR